MMNLRTAGIQETKDARELELKHIKLTPLDGVDRARQSILDSGVDAALNEVSQGTIEKASDELEQRVQELIDKRNDITPAQRRAKRRRKQRKKPTKSSWTRTRNKSQRTKLCWKPSEQE